MTIAAPPVIRVANRPLGSNTYLYPTTKPGECLLIDPGLDRDAIEAALGEAGLVPRAIFCTHGHFDHLGSAEHFRTRYAVPLHLHGADARVARASNFLMMALKVPGRITVPAEHVAIDEGVAWSDGPDRVEALHVPGHTPGSVVLLVGGRVFTGDTLYREGTWLVSLPEENRERLVASLERLWDVLPDESLVLPGHGGGGAFGEIKRSNGALRDLLGRPAEVVA